MMRLLAKFLGLVVFLPYSRTDSNLPHNIRETEVSVRSKVGYKISILSKFILTTWNLLNPLLLFLRSCLHWTSLSVLLKPTKTIVWLWLSHGLLNFWEWWIQCLLYCLYTKQSSNFCYGCTWTWGRESVVAFFERICHFHHRQCYCYAFLWDGSLKHLLFKRRFFIPGVLTWMKLWCVCKPSISSYVLFLLDS